MLLKTRCIVLKQFDYSDNTIIVHAFTREMGKVVFMVRVSKSKNSKLRKTLFQPLFLLEIESSLKNNRDIQHISEARLFPPHNSIPYHPHKTAISLFLSEILYNCLKEESASFELYDFIESSISFFDLQEEKINDFHIVFLAKLLKFMGFSPSIPDNNFSYFDIQNGCFSITKPMNNQIMETAETQAFINCLSGTFSNIPDLSLVRKSLLENILEYYKIHLLNDKEPKSLSVLKEIFG